MEPVGLRHNLVDEELGAHHILQELVEQAEDHRSLAELELEVFVVFVGVDLEALAVVVEALVAAVYFQEVLVRGDEGLVQETRTLV